MSDDVIIAFLLTWPTVASLVGGRGYPYGLLPQSNGQIASEMPAFTVATWENETSHSYTASERQDEIRYMPIRTQIDVYGESGLSVKLLSETIRDILDGFSGAMSNHTIGMCIKRGLFNISRSPETLLYHRMMDFELHVMN